MHEVFDDIPDPHPFPGEVSAAHELYEILLSLVDSLEPKYKKVVFLRFGFESQPATLKEIGLRIGRSRSVVRTYEVRAMTKLRNGLLLTLCNAGRDWHQRVANLCHSSLSYAYGQFRLGNMCSASQRAWCGANWKRKSRSSPPSSIVSDELSQTFDVIKSQLPKRKPITPLSCSQLTV